MSSNWSSCQAPVTDALVSHSFIWKQAYSNKKFIVLKTNIPLLKVFIFPQSTNLSIILRCFQVYFVYVSPLASVKLIDLFWKLWKFWKENFLNWPNGPGLFEWDEKLFQLSHFQRQTQRRDYSTAKLLLETNLLYVWRREGNLSLFCNCRVAMTVS